jgi:hypothetical protein
VIGVKGAGDVNSLWIGSGAVVANLHPAGADKFSTYESRCGQSYYWHIAGALSQDIVIDSHRDGLDISYYAFLLRISSFFRGGSAIDTTEVIPFLHELKQSGTPSTSTEWQATGQHQGRAGVRSRAQHTSMHSATEGYEHIDTCERDPETHCLYDVTAEVQSQKLLSSDD